MKSIIINADDFGLTDGVSECIIELFEHQAISSTTLMICVDGAVRRCKNLLGREFNKHTGVHLQTTPEMHHRKPLSPAKEIPTLVDSSGDFKPKDHTDWINPDEVELEWERQIVKTADVLGHLPSHLDSHHGRHRIETLTPIYLKLAAKYQIPVRGGRTLHQIDGSSYGVKSTALCDAEWTGQNKGILEFKTMVLELLEIIDNGTLEIVTHPGICDDDLKKSSSWNSVRENDRKVLLDIAQENWLETAGIELISFSDLY